MDTLLVQLDRLKLTAIRDQLDTLLDEAARSKMTLREALSFLVTREIARRDERRISMSSKLAQFPFVRELDSFDFEAQPSLDPGQLRDLATCRWIAHGDAVLFLGPPGVGKLILPWPSAARLSGRTTASSSSRPRRWSQCSPRRMLTARWTNS